MRYAIKTKQNLPPLHRIQKRYLSSVPVGLHSALFQVHQDIMRINMSGIPITNMRASKFMKKWGLERFRSVLEQLFFSLVAASFMRWKKGVMAIKKQEKLDAYLQYQGSRRMQLFLRNFLLKHLAHAWILWWEIVEAQRAIEQVGAYDFSFQRVLEPLDLI